MTTIIAVDAIQITCTFHKIFREQKDQGKLSIHRFGIFTILFFSTHRITVISIGTQRKLCACVIFLLRLVRKRITSQMIVLFSPFLHQKMTKCFMHFPYSFKLSYTQSLLRKHTFFNKMGF